MKKISMIFSLMLSFLMVNPVFAAVLAGADAAVTKITTDGVDTITAIGTALLLLSALVLVYRWAKAAFF